jgi:hypothetical protein
MAHCLVKTRRSVTHNCIGDDVPVFFDMEIMIRARGLAQAQQAMNLLVSAVRCSCSNRRHTLGRPPLHNFRAAILRGAGVGRQGTGQVVAAAPSSATADKRTVRNARRVCPADVVNSTRTSVFWKTSSRTKSWPRLRHGYFLLDGSKRQDPPAVTTIATQASKRPVMLLNDFM